ncbi:Y-family DNA polymerase [Roseibium litorale]|uniref:DNA-directed DNA polymerase n=1 Tax=Roseibium litorale TaxID=2803841 RepID=A0ABR9CJR1_9HYPH|nr:DNA polymerase Y family protein [Roseibium litorale]MBD8891095.1 DNA polymerase Y family protein [Roseibium litorale]
MFDGLRKRIVCMWFPRLASDRVLRARPVDGPFALTLTQNNTNRIYCLNRQAEQAGLSRGMSFADARAYCPGLITHPARPDLDARFLVVLRRWAARYCPSVGAEGMDGLTLDVTGATHLWGGEEAMLDDMRARAERAGLSLLVACSHSRGAAWALAHYGQEGGGLETLPVAALRLEGTMITSLERLGLRTIADLEATARAPLARRFGPQLLTRLDQAFGRAPEALAPEGDPPHYGVRLSFPDPIGLTGDVMNALERLLKPLCTKLKAQETGARCLVLTFRRVDQESQDVPLRLAAPMRDPERLLRLFERGVGEVEAGFGIDQMRLEATLVEPLPAEQLSTAQTRPGEDRLSDLITRIGTRIGLENIQRFLPSDSHIPERSFMTVPAAFNGTPSAPGSGWRRGQLRPLRLFPPVPILGTGSQPPNQFRWRRMAFRTFRAMGPERIAPEWWQDDENWRSGVRDYWKVDTREGQRLWLFYTPQNPGWFVQGEFA